MGLAPAWSSARPPPAAGARRSRPMRSRRTAWPEPRRKPRFRCCATARAPTAPSATATATVPPTPALCSHRKPRSSPRESRPSTATIRSAVTVSRTPSSSVSAGSHAREAGSSKRCCAAPRTARRPCIAVPPDSPPAKRRSSIRPHSIPRLSDASTRARATFLKSCEGHCQDPPDCFDLTCPQTLTLVEQDAAALQPTTYCQEPGICGDGQVTGAEACDSSASPSGCRIGTQCFGCSACSTVCGDGIVAPPEVCDPNANPTGCAPGYQCSFGCGECFPVCGDGMLVPGELSDQSAPQNGCPTGQVCDQSCDFCEIPCGNGQLDTGEVCDRNSIGTCALGTACDVTCDACNPTVTGTEDLRVAISPTLTSGRSRSLPARTS